MERMGIRLARVVVEGLHPCKYIGALFLIYDIKARPTGLNAMTGHDSNLNLKLVGCMTGALIPPTSSFNCMWTHYRQALALDIRKS